MKEVKPQALQFHEWLNERRMEFGPPGNVRNLPEMPPQLEDVRVIRADYERTRNDLRMLRAFAAIVLECEEADLTADRLDEHMAYLEDVRAKMAAQYMRERDNAIQKADDLQYKLDLVRDALIGAEP